jgi:hypothetical protein
MARPRTKLKAELVRRIDIATWHRKGLLRTKCSFERFWTVDSKKTGAVKVVVEPCQSVTLNYECGTGNSKEEISMSVRMPITPCHFGGSRPWFECPICNKRVGILYLVHRYFECRRCANVAYSSQSETPSNRAFRAETKILAKLGPKAKKPRWMRRKTFCRLEDKLIDIMIKRDQLFEARMANFMQPRKRRAP